MVALGILYTRFSAWDVHFNYGMLSRKTGE